MPGGLCARAFLWCELRWNVQSRTQISRRVSGVGTVLMLVALAGGVGAVLHYGLLVFAGPGAWPLIALLAVAGLAQRSRYDHVASVALALEAGDAAAAPAAVALIVGRRTERLAAAIRQRACTKSC